MKTTFILLFLFSALSCLVNLQENEPIDQTARKLIDTTLPDITSYLDALKPNNQAGTVFNAQQKRLKYLKRTDRWITQLQAKLDRMKFITSSRLATMGDNLNRKLKSRGFNPIIKYHRLYNKLMLPMVNPYTQMNADNTIYTPPEAQGDPSFQAFQKNLQSYGTKYADTIAQWQSGVWDENSAFEKYDGK